MEGGKKKEGDGGTVRNREREKKKPVLTLTQHKDPTTPIHVSEERKVAKTGR